jgi:ubiquinone/menaquinone biosynthesis C-methylase UbiE
MRVDSVSNRLVHAEQVQQLFDAKALTWSAKYVGDGRLTGRLTHLLDAVNSHAPAQGCVLDLGCGTGELARELASKGLHVVGCDISAEMLSLAAHDSTAPDVHWIQLNTGWTALPFEACAFDVIAASSVLEYVADPAAVLHECARVLRHGGTLVCTVPNICHPVRWLEAIAQAGTSRSAALVVGRVEPRVADYIAYLRASRQRHSASWWSATAAKAGLQQRTTVTRADRSTLRLFVFRRPNDLEVNA